MILKNKMIALALVFSLGGCATVENTYDSILLEQTFNSSFSHTINNQNTLEDNKKLLSMIQSDSVIMSILKRNTKPKDSNYDFFLQYKSLVDNIVIEERIIEKNQKEEPTKKTVIVDENPIVKPKPVVVVKPAINTKTIPLDNKIETKTKQVKPESSKGAVITAAKTEETSLKSKQKPVTSEKAVNLTPVKKIVSTFEKPVLNNDDLKFKYLKIKDELKNSHFIILSHCNVEDAHLLKNDIDNYKNKVLSLSDNNEELVKYAFQINKREFKPCFDLHLDSQS